MALLTYDWHPPDPTGAVNAYLSGVKIGAAQQEAAAREREMAAKLASDALERERLRKRFEDQHAMQLQQEARLAGAEQLRQSYHAARDARTAAELLAQNNAADAIRGQFSNPALPSGGAVDAGSVGAPDVAQSIIATDPSDPLIGRPPPIDPQDNATFDDFSSEADAAIPAIPNPAAMNQPIVPMQVHRGPAPLTAGLPGAPDYSQPAPRAAGGLPVASPVPLPASQLLAPADGYAPVAKPARGTAVPDVAAMLRAMPPKDVIAVAKQATAAQLRDAMKPAATPKPDPLRTMPDGSLARVGADNTVKTIATKPEPTPKPVTPAQDMAMTIKQRDQLTDDSKRFAGQLKDLTKDKSEAQLGYPWQENGKYYKIGKSGSGRTSITEAEYKSGVEFADKVKALRASIMDAEKRAADLGNKIVGTAPAGSSTHAGVAPASPPGPVTTKAQFDALPSGATYTGKDGRTYRKP